GFLLKDWMRLAQIDKKKRTARNTNDIIENLHMKADSLNRIHHYQKDKRVVNFTNGTLFITNKGKKTFIPHHDKKHGVMNMLEFEYNPDALCPKWNKFINKVLPDEKDRETLMQFIGYCFFPGHDYEAYLFLYGKSGANGKSVILDVLRKFFGDDNISNLNIQQFVGHELHGLANKLINIGSELDAKGLNDGQMGVLKALTSTNDAVQINPKFTKGYPLASRHQPKLINSGNAKPNPKVMDDGVYRRTLLLEFDYEIKDDEKIRDLSTRFNDELSGIMAYALRSLDTLILNGKFTKSDRLLGSIEEYKDQTNPIRAFIKDNIIEDETIIVPKKLLYAFYKSWCEEKGLYTTSEPKFFTQIFENIKSAEDKKQLRVPVQNPLVEILGTERPNWIGGIYVKSQDLISFMYKNKETTTESLNRNIDTKQVIIKEKDD
ncbi:MAG: phage/plasmid primase, P4 family, partial [Bacteroidota bacterium]|nr:phage/plasmid primase, P4 family [Bacteroidota bacterium]